MKDYRAIIDTDVARNIIYALSDLGYIGDCIEGALQDNYFYNLGKNKLKLGRVKFRKYLIIREKYLNEYSSCLELILTNSAKLYEMTLEKCLC